jgi:hypothetical protein
MTPIELSFSLLLFAIETGFDVLGKMKDAKEDSTRDLMARHTDWLRRKEHAEVVALVTADHERLEVELGRLGGEMQAVAARMLEGFAVELRQVEAQVVAAFDTFTGAVLSPIPLNLRQYADVGLAGRDEDLAFLQGEARDVLLYGEPGSGKTFLLYHHIREKGGLFVLTDDPDKLVGAIRAKRPPIVIVDDCADRMDVLRRLIHARLELGLNYRIIAICWPFEADAVATAWTSTPVVRRLLELLPRKTISGLVEGMIKTAGYVPVNAIVWEINNQASGRPGLALQLTSICLHQDTQALFDGNELKSRLEALVEKAAGDAGMDILAAFAVGGKAGMMVEDAARVLGQSPLVVSRAIKNLAAGGILATSREGRITVRPDALRRALIREHFLPPSGAALTGMYESLLTTAPDRESAILSLLMAVKTGAAVSPDWLFQKVSSINRAAVWASYASLDAAACRRVLVERPDLISAVKVPALHYWPDRTICMFLQSAGRSAPGPHVAASFGQWIKASRPGTPEASARRVALLVNAIRWANEGGDLAVAMEAIKLGFSLRFEATENDPGEGMTVTWMIGIVWLKDAEAIYAQWPLVLDFIRRTAPSTLVEASKLMEDWLHPHAGFGQGPDERYLAWLKEKALTMMKDILSAGGSSHQGIIRRFIEALQEPERAGLGVQTSPLFMVLYPMELLSGDFDADAAARRASADGLVEDWITRNPREVAAETKAVETMAADVGISWPRMSPYVFGRIAERVADPEPWLAAAMDNELPGDLVAPLLERLAGLDMTRAEPFLLSCLDRQAYGATAIQVALRHNGTPEVVFQRVASCISGHLELVEHLCWADRVSDSHLPRLLMNKDPKVRFRAALGDFRGDGKRLLKSFPERWTAEIARGLAELDWHAMKPIFDLDRLVAAAPALPYMILKAKCEGDGHVFQGDDALPRLAGHLTKAQKMELLGCCRSGFHLGMVRLLVWDDLDLYGEVLKDKVLADSHLEPLMGDPSTESWQAKARAAFAAGYSAADIVQGPFLIGWSISGPASAYWQSWVERYKKLAVHEDPILKKIGEAGVAYVANWLASAIEKERREMVLGRFGEGE